MFETIKKYLAQRKYNQLVKSKVGLTTITDMNGTRDSLLDVREYPINPIRQNPSTERYFLVSLDLLGNPEFEIVWPPLRHVRVLNDGDVVVEYYHGINLCVLAIETKDEGLVRKLKEAETTLSRRESPRTPYRD